jgi:hypothetical protein
MHAGKISLLKDIALARYEILSILHVEFLVDLENIKYSHVHDQYPLA